MSTAAAPPRTERVVVIGAGIAGLASVLTLHRSTRQIIVVERDPAPPILELDSVFESWWRPGVPQFKHTHTFLARLHAILRRHHPQLLAELQAAGFWPSTPAQSMPARLLERYPSIVDDPDLAHLWGRRATFEYVLRRHVARLANVEFLHGARFEGLVMERTRDDDVWVRAVEVSSRRRPVFLDADYVVDASGARSRSHTQLNSFGACIGSERVASRCRYYCQHFQADHASFTFEQTLGATLDYLVFGVFLAEHGRFSIAIACPERDRALTETLRHPLGFTQVCRQIPALAHWTERATAVSRVFGGAQTANRWRHYARRGRPRVLSFYPVGDAYVQTNPIYGRGCASAFVQAHALAAALDEHGDPGRRATAYHRQVWKLMRPHFDFCLRADSGFLIRAKFAQGHDLSGRAHLFSRAFEQLFLPAIEESRLVAREWRKLQQMAEVSPPWMLLAVLCRMLQLWLVRTLLKRRWQLPDLGPARHELLLLNTQPNAPHELGPSAQVHATASDEPPASD